MARGWVTSSGAGTGKEPRNRNLMNPESSPHSASRKSEGGVIKPWLSGGLVVAIAVIRHGGNLNSYYDDPHEVTSRFDFAVPTPPARAKRLSPFSLASESTRPCI